MWYRGRGGDAVRAFQWWQAAVRSSLWYGLLLYIPSPLVSSSSSLSLCRLVFSIIIILFLSFDGLIWLIEGTGRRRPTPPPPPHHGDCSHQLVAPSDVRRSLLLFRWEFVLEYRPGACVCLVRGVGRRRRRRQNRRKLCCCCCWLGLLVCWIAPSLVVSMLTGCSPLLLSLPLSLPTSLINVSCEWMKKPFYLKATMQSVIYL